MEINANSCLTLMAINWNVNVSLIILYVARINGRLMDRLMIIIRFILFSTLMAVNWNVNWSLIILRQVLNKGEDVVRGGRNPLPYKNKSLSPLRLVIVCYSSAYV